MSERLPYSEVDRHRIILSVHRVEHSGIERIDPSHDPIGEALYTMVQRIGVSEIGDGVLVSLQRVELARRNKHNGQITGEDAKVIEYHGELPEDQQEAVDNGMLHFSIMRNGSDDSARIFYHKIDREARY